MGAIIGALYASGMSGKEIKERISKLLVLKDDTWRDILANTGSLTSMSNRRSKVYGCLIFAKSRKSSCKQRQPLTC